MNVSKKSLLKTLLPLLLVMLLLAGCSNSAANKGADTSADIRTMEADAPLATQAMGALILSVNPKVEISYNSNGLVINLKGLNEDGEKIVAAYGTYEGQTCREVTCALIEKMQEAGYFYSENGEQKNIVLQLAAGSLCPDDSFLENVTEGVKVTVNGLSESNNTVLNLPVVSPTPAPVAQTITLEQAKEIAINYGLFAEDVEVVFTEEKLDGDVFELEFTVGNHQYEVEISMTGEVLKFEAEYLSPEATKNTEVTSFITLEEAKKIALQHADLASKKDAVFTKEEFDHKKGQYELEILYDGYEYGVKVDASTGNVLEMEVEATKHTAPDTSLKKVTMEEAKAVVLKDLKLKSATFDKEEYDAFEEEYELELTVNGVEYEYTISACTGEILEKEWDEKEMAKSTPKPGDTSSFVGMDKAKKAALKHAGLTGKAVTYEEAKLEKEDGKYVYEIEFVYEGMEYEYEIDAVTGSVLKSEKEKAD